LIVISNAFLSGEKYNNLFGEAHPEDGVAIFTFNNVPEIIIPTEKIKSYIAYYIARYTFNFLIPDHTTHNDTRGCVFDMKIQKTDIIKSMKAGSLCDDCRRTVTNPNYNISASQFTSLNLIFSKVEELYTINIKIVEEKAKKARIFIGSSVEGKNVAIKIQNELSHDYDISIWHQGLFDKLGLSFLETLEEIVNTFDYGIFIFTPDDKIESRGQTKAIARDNVIFELGLFVGKLTRKKTFLVYPQKNDIHILSDFAGITTASYDGTASNLQAALGPVCDKIRTSIGN
jgi:predicted nucleotide-binding protein